MANVIEVVIRARDDAKGTIDRVRAALAGLEAQGGPVAGVFNKVGASLGAIGPAGIVAAAGATALAGATTIATNAFVNAVKEGAAFGDELNKVSVQTGLTVEEVSRLKFAADQNESSLAALTSSIKFMSKNLFEAQQGGKEQIETLKALGFEGEEAAGHLGSTGEALLKVSDRLKTIPDQGTRTALAMRLMGRGALEALPLMQQGSSVIKAYGDEADRTGITVSSLAGKLGDDFNDAVSKVNAQIAGLKTKLAEAALPAFITVVDSVSGAFAELTKTVNENKEAIAALANALAAIANVTIKISVIGVEAVKGALDLLAPLAEVTKAAEQSRNQDLKKQQAFATGQKDAQGRDIYAQIIPIIDGIETSVARVNKGKEKSKALTDAEKAALEKLKAEQEAYATAVERSYLVSNVLADSLRAAFGIKPATDLVNDFQKALEDAAKEAANLGNTVGKIKLPTNAEGKPLTAAQAIEQGIVNQQPDLGPEKFNPGTQIDEATAKLLEFNDALANSVRSFEPIVDIFHLVNDSIAEADNLGRQLFENLLTGGKGVAASLESLFSGLANLLKKIIADLIFAIAKAGILAAITGKSFFSFLPFSQGGQVKAVSGGEVSPQRFVSGGTAPQVARFVQGGAVAGALALAAGGSIALPGLASGGALAPSVPNITNIIRLSVGGAIGPVSSHNVDMRSHLVRGGSISHFVNGGSVGDVSTIFNSSNVIHAAGGMKVVPGFPQSYDSVPALLAPGEVVLPNVGGKSPSDLLGNLSNMSRDLSALIAQQKPVYQAQMGRGPAIGTVKIHAFDWEGMRNQVRGGALDRELARREELGRGL